MKIRKTIQRVIVLTAWILVCCGMIALLTAANHKKGEHVCKKVVVSIKGEGEQLFLDEQGIFQQLNTVTNGTLVNRLIAEINLAFLEKELEKHQWIKEAEIYFDSQDVLHLVVSEKVPVARVFTTSGASFYIDSAGNRLPLLEKVTVRLPVVTNFPAAKRLNEKENLLLHDLKYILQFISHNPFWKAQIAQIDITSAGKFEAIPVVGNHIIKLGTAEDIESKLHRLYIFYKQVLSKAGFDKYNVLDVQYKGQVVALNKVVTSPVDSIQLQKNIQELVAKSRMRMIEDSVTTERIKEILKEDTTAKPLYELWPKQMNNDEDEEDPNTGLKAEKEREPMKEKGNVVKPKQVVKPIEKAKPTLPKGKKPKAIMPSKVVR
ncbi:MAG: hypothetical protein ICV65_12805 [Flavisolibacter sp.]|nr:hypothetical protein [Flavisolibacter sp.]